MLDVKPFAMTGAAGMRLADNVGQVQSAVKLPIGQSPSPLVPEDPAMHALLW